MMRKLLLVAFAVAFIACVSAENEDRYRSERDERFRPYRSGPDLTRDDILHNLDKRKRTLEDTLESTKKNLANHNDGTEKVDDAEYQRLLKRAEMLTKKISQMENVDDREIERHKRREEQRWERRTQRARDLYDEF